MDIIEELAKAKAAYKMITENNEDKENLLEKYKKQCLIWSIISCVGILVLFIGLIL